jgi:hypothetical protein
MYAWINSAQGMKELNLYSAYGDNTEWKKISQHDVRKNNGDKVFGSEFAL